MDKGYKIRNKDGIYFLTFAVVEWVDACFAGFSRKDYAEIVVESLKYCQKEKGKPKKHPQTKLGVEMLFGQAGMNGQLIDILIESVVIVDMTNYRNHWIKKKENRAWLKDFVQRLREKEIE